MRKFKVQLEWGDDGWWTVTVPALPGCISQGRTRQEALENIREAIELHLEATAPSRDAPVGEGRFEEAEVSVESATE